MVYPGDGQNPRLRQLFLIAVLKFPVVGYDFLDAFECINAKTA